MRSTILSKIVLTFVKKHKSMSPEKGKINDSSVCFKVLQIAEYHINKTCFQHSCVSQLQNDVSFAIADYLKLIYFELKAKKTKLIL